MALFDRLKERRTEQIRRNIADKAGSISLHLANAIRQEHPGPYPFEIGSPPIGCEPEGYIHKIKESVLQHLGERGLSTEVAYDPMLTHQACSEDTTVRANQFPPEVKARLTVVFNRAA